MSLKQHSALGKEGEIEAQKYLEKKGYTVLATNFYIAKNKGEIDVIAQKENTYLFVEVKTRKKGYSIPVSALIPLSKQKKIILTALAFCQKEDITTTQSIIRFDIIYITEKKIKHYPNAFTLQ
jgi:putative endonuclease